jgi:hypothetical protein
MAKPEAGAACQPERSGTGTHRGQNRRACEARLRAGTAAPPEPLAHWAEAGRRELIHAICVRGTDGQ